MIAILTPKMCAGHCFSSFVKGDAARLCKR